MFDPYYVKIPAIENSLGEFGANCKPIALTLHGHVKNINLSTINIGYDSGNLFQDLLPSLQLICKATHFSSEFPRNFDGFRSKY